jgi:hypothetical protein
LLPPVDEHPPCRRPQRSMNAMSVVASKRRHVTSHLSITGVCHVGVWQEVTLVLYGLRIRRLDGSGAILSTEDTVGDHGHDWMSSWLVGLLTGEEGSLMDPTAGSRYALSDPRQRSRPICYWIVPSFHRTRLPIHSPRHSSPTRSFVVPIGRADVSSSYWSVSACDIILCHSFPTRRHDPFLILSRTLTH